MNETPMEKYLNWAFEGPISIERWSEPWTAKRAVLSFLWFILFLPWLFVQMPVMAVMMFLQVVFMMMESE